MKCPFCDTELIGKWEEYFSLSKQRITKQLFWHCPKHNKTFQIFGGKLKEVNPNSKVYRNPETRTDWDLMNECSKQH